MTTTSLPALKANLNERIAELDAYIGGDLQRASVRDQYVLFLLAKVAVNVRSMHEVDAVRLLTDIASGRSVWDLVGSMSDFDAFTHNSATLLLDQLDKL